MHACIFGLGKKGNEKFTVILLNQMDVVAMKKKSSVFGWDLAWADTLVLLAESLSL